jgi:hypothetical protein
LNITGKRPTTGIVTEEVETNIGPALLTVPSDFVPRCNHKAEVSTVDDDEEDSKLESSFENLRIIYEPLLIAMTSVYPGFAPALFVHLIDSILCLEHAAENACHDKDQLDCRIHHLTQWVRYVLSRAFHMHFDRSVAMIAQNEAAAVQHLKQEHPQQQAVTEPLLQIPQQLSQNSLPRPILFDLKKRGRKKWNTYQLRYMQSPLDFQSLSGIGFPLNSVCDRLFLLRQQRSSIHCGMTSTSRVMRLYQYLQDIIGEKDRILFMGISTYNSCCLGAGYDNTIASDPNRCSTAAKVGVGGRKECHLGLGSRARLRPSGAAAEGLESLNEPLPLTISSKTNKMSLEDMEAIFSGEGNMNGDGDSPSIYSPDRKLDVVNCPTMLDDNSHNITQPWTLCNYWDACAIGALPGYPS